MRGFSQPDQLDAPEVRLGIIAEGGLAPAIMAIVERGVVRRPAKARELGIEVELRMEERYPPVRIAFGDDVVLVEDGPAHAPALRISGALSDLVALLVAPLVRGVPSPIDSRGRAALGMFASRRVRVEGEIGKMRGFLSVLTL
jgi:hypothetical protein